VKCFLSYEVLHLYHNAHDIGCYIILHSITPKDILGTILGSNQGGVPHCVFHNNQILENDTPIFHQDVEDRDILLIISDYSNSYLFPPSKLWWKVTVRITC
jgi:hypothetical protein